MSQYGIDNGEFSLSLVKSPVSFVLQHNNHHGGYLITWPKNNDIKDLDSFKPPNSPKAWNLK